MIRHVSSITPPNIRHRVLEEAHEEDGTACIFRLSATPPHPPSPFISIPRTCRLSSCPPDDHHICACGRRPSQQHNFHRCVHPRKPLTSLCEEQRYYTRLMPNGGCGVTPTEPQAVTVKQQYSAPLTHRAAHNVKSCNERILSTPMCSVQITELTACNFGLRHSDHTNQLTA